ncbi:MAG: 4Fe-4S dicluster domain-containing protein [Ruminococcaceae bacterium]|nr:4Fe-4S dicluster domain-containing protein [Oscillospiraceae bacterium]
MIAIKNKQDCCGCEACYNACPENCIRMEFDEEGFKFPQVDSDKCINCKKCINVCPIINKKAIVNEIKEGYAAINKYDNIRLQSSSGGVFSALATHMLEDGGVVVGCAMTEDCKKAQHIVVEDPDDLIKLYGSKYIQSEINKIYLDVKLRLERNQKVLFSGTPCQVEGLKSFLGKRYDNLICIDLICHGVPSPLLWKSNAEHIEKKKHLKLTAVNFRCKKYGGHSEYGVSYGKNRKMYYQPKEVDSYFQFFLKDISLRKSCYDCRFKGIERVSDITLGDFWGIEDYAPDLNDGKGSSIVVIHSKKGKATFEAIISSLDVEQVDVDVVFANHNKAMCESSRMPNERSDFWKDYQKRAYKQLRKKYAHVSMKTRLKIILKRIGLLDNIRQRRKSRG